MNLPISALSLLQLVATPAYVAKQALHFRQRKHRYYWDARRLRRFNTAFSSGKNVGPGPHFILMARASAESRVALKIAGELKKVRPHWRISLSYLDEEEIVGFGIQFKDIPTSLWPYQTVVLVRRWIAKFRPDAVVFVERYGLPTMAGTLREAGIPLASVGTKSGPSSRGWRKIVTRRYQKWLLMQFDLVCARNRQVFRILSAYVGPKTKLEYLGSLKFPAGPPVLEETRRNELKNWISASKGERPLFAGGSTHPGDEEVVLDAFDKLRRKWDCALLLAPRNSARADEVAKLCADRGYTVSHRSRWVGGEAGTADVLLLDSTGELSGAYRDCHAAFVGGTRLNATFKTGQNVTEPIGWGVPTYYGLSRLNFVGEQEACEEAEVGFPVADAAQLAELWERLLSDEAWRLELRTRCLATAEAGFQGWRDTVEALVQWGDSVKTRG